MHSSKGDIADEATRALGGPEKIKQDRKKQTDRNTSNNWEIKG